MEEVEASGGPWSSELPLASHLRSEDAGLRNPLSAFHSYLLARVSIFHFSRTLAAVLIVSEMSLCEMLVSDNHLQESSVSPGVCSWVSL